MTIWQKIKHRLGSWAVWAALLAMVAFVSKQWLGWQIPGWDEFGELLLGVLVAFGIVNNPDSRGEF